MAVTPYQPKKKQQPSAPKESAVRTSGAVKPYVPKSERGDDGGIGATVLKGVGSAFDIIGRPGQAVTSGLAQATSSDEDSGTEMLKAMWAGLQGKRRDTFADIVTNPTNEGRAPEDRYELKGPAGFGVNLVGGVVSDPLTYLTFGTSTAAKSGLRTVESTLGKQVRDDVARHGIKALQPGQLAQIRAAVTPKVFEALERGAQGGVKVAGRTVPGLTNATGRAAVEASGAGKAARALADTAPARFAADVFVPRAAVVRTKGRQVADALNTARIKFRGTVASNVEDTLVRLQHVAKQVNPNAEDLVKVSRSLDMGGRGASGLPSRLRPLYDELAQLRDTITNEQVAAGVLQPGSILPTSEYFPRYLTPKGAKFLRKEQRAGQAVRAGGGPLKADSGNVKRRLFRPDEAAADIRTPGGDEIFGTNPLTAFGRRAAEAHRDVAKRGYVDDLLAITDDAGDAVVRPLGDFRNAAGQVDLPDGWAKIDVPRVGEFAAPVEIANDVKNVMSLFVSDETLNTFVRFADRWMALWKGYATVGLGPASGGYFFRNGIGNLTQIHMAGGVGIGDFAHAQKLQRTIAKGRKAGDVYKFLSPSDARLVREMRQLDILGSGVHDVELAGDVFTSAAKPVGRFNVNPLNPQNAVIRSGRAIGNVVEDNARIALFVAKRRELGSADEAAAVVRKYLLDYSDVTAVERQVFRRAKAFYTWTARNVPLQVEAFLKTPGKLSAYQHLAEALAAQGPEIEDMPAYLAEGGAVPVPQGVVDFLSRIPGLRFEEGTPAALEIGNTLPAASAVRTVRPFAQLAAELPGANRIPGLARNENGPFDALAEVLSDNLSGGAPGLVSSGMQAALGRALFGDRRLTGRQDTAPYLTQPFVGDTISDQAEFLLNQNVPLAGKIDSLIPASEYGQERAGRRRLSSLAGISLTQIAEEAQRRERQRQRDLAKRKREAQR